MVYASVLHCWLADSVAFEECCVETQKMILEGRSYIRSAVCAQSCKTMSRTGGFWFLGGMVNVEDSDERRTVQLPVI